MTKNVSLSIPWHQFYDQGKDLIFYLADKIKNIAITLFNLAKAGGEILFHVGKETFCLMKDLSIKGFFLAKKASIFSAKHIGAFVQRYPTECLSAVGGALTTVLLLSLYSVLLGEKSHVS